MIEFKHMRRENAATFGNADGTVTSVIYAGPAFYDNWDGRGDGEPGWRRIDPTPQPTDKGWLVQFCHYRAELPRMAGDELTYTQLWGDGKQKQSSLTMRAVGVNDVAGSHEVIDGVHCIVYPDAFGVGADLIYTAFVTGIGKYVRVRSGHSGTDYTFYIGTAEDVERLGPGGYVLERTGPKTLDKRRMTSIGDIYLRPMHARWGDTSIPLAVEIAPVDGGWNITKTTPKEWDGSADLWMDATTTGTLAAQANSCILHTQNSSPQTQANWDTVHDAATGTTVDSGDPSYMYLSSYWKNNVTRQYRVWRGFLAFDVVLPTGATVTAASLTMTLAGATTRTATAISVSAASWSGGVATITTASAHQAITGDTVVIASSNPSGYNGTHTVLSTPSSTQYTVAIASDPGSYVGSGTSRTVRGVTVVAGTQASATSLTTADYDAVGSTNFARRGIDTTATGSQEFAFTAAGLSAIANGTNKFALRDSMDFDDNYPQDSQNGTGNSWTFGSYESGTAPTLSVTYATPSAAAMMMMGIG